MLAHEILKHKTQTIVTIIDQSQDGILKDYKCVCCGRTLFQYYGAVKLIMPGEVEIEWLDIVGRPKLVQCKNKRTIYVDGRWLEVKCKTMYYIIG